MIEHDVFRNAQAGDQRHVHLLLHQMDAQLFGIHRLPKDDGLVINADFAFIARVRAAQYRHQGGFAGTVRARERVYRSTRQREIDARQRLKARKSQADAAHLEATG